MAQLGLNILRLGYGALALVASSAICLSGIMTSSSLQTKQMTCSWCFIKNGPLFLSFIIHSKDDQFKRNFYQL